MSLGHKNPKTTAKARTRALAGMSSELVPMVRVCLEPPALLSALGECYFPELGWGEQATGFIALFSFDLITNISGFIYMPKYTRTIQIPPRSLMRSLRVQRCQNVCEFSSPPVRLLQARALSHPRLR